MTRKLRRHTATGGRTQWIITASVGLAVGLGIALAAPATAPTQPAEPSPTATAATEPQAEPEPVRVDEARMKADLYGYLLDLVHEDPALFEKIVKRILAAPESVKQHMTALRAWTKFGTSDPLPELCRVVANPATPVFIRTWAHQQIELRCKADPSRRAAVKRLLAAKPTL